MRARLAGAWAKTKSLVTTEPGQDEGAGERAWAQSLATSSATERAGLAKLAQLAGYFCGPDAVADEDGREALIDLCDRAAALPFSEIAPTLSAELGAQRRALEDVQEVPFAAASLGQVHRARVAGRDVAIKVQYPGVADSLRQDLESDGQVRRYLGVRAGAGLEQVGVDALREALLAELDYRQEAALHRKFATAFDGHPSIAVPKLVDELCTERVLTMELLEGERLVSAARFGREVCDRLGALIFRFFHEAALVHGLVHGDPNPGNVLALPDGRLGVVDFGSAAVLSAEALARERRILTGLLMEDGVRGVEQFRLALVESGVARVASMGSANQASWEEVWTRPYRTSEPFAFDRRYAARFAEATSDLLRLGGLAMTPELMLLWRTRLGLPSLLAGLAPRIGSRAIVAELLQR